MQAALIKNLNVTLPGSLQSTLTQSRTITQMTGQTVTGIVDTVRINSQPFVTAFDGNAKRYTNTTPEGRKTFSTMDANGRVVNESIPGFSPITSAYDSKGRLTQAVQSGRVTSFLYDAKGQIASVTLSSQRTACDSNLTQPNPVTAILSLVTVNVLLIHPIQLSCVLPSIESKN